MRTKVDIYVFILNLKYFSLLVNYYFYLHKCIHCYFSLSVYCQWVDTSAGGQLVHGAEEWVSFDQKSEFQLRTSLLGISIIEICSY